MHGWTETVERYGILSLRELFEGAIGYAEHGFPVTKIIAGEWNDVADILRAHEGTATCYPIDGKAIVNFSERPGNYRPGDPEHSRGIRPCGPGTQQRRVSPSPHRGEKDCLP